MQTLNIKTVLKKAGRQVGKQAVKQSDRQADSQAGKHAGCKQALPVVLFPFCFVCAFFAGYPHVRM